MKEDRMSTSGINCSDYWNQQQSDLMFELGLLLQSCSDSGFCTTTSTGVTPSHPDHYYSGDHLLSSFEPLEVGGFDKGGGGQPVATLLSVPTSKEDEHRESDHEDTGKEDDGERRPKKRICRQSTKQHNLSERRRRQELKEKMTALQQLIPNCSKKDTASILDDAIHYMKSLQYQLQVMNMAAANTMLYSPWKMCLQPGVQGMQNLGFPKLQHAGLQAGMGYGMGMEMPPGPSPVDFVLKQIELHNKHIFFPSSSSGTLQGTSELQSFWNLAMQCYGTGTSELDTNLLSK